MVLRPCLYTTVTFVITAIAHDLSSRIADCRIVHIKMLNISSCKKWKNENNMKWNVIRFGELEETMKRMFLS